MIRRTVKEINAEFVAEERNLTAIQRTVREACAAAGMNRKTITSVLLAVEEAATNIIRHAYLFEKGAIRLRIAVYKQLIVFSLIDTGRSFQPGHEGRLDLDRLVETGRKGGLGFYLIQKIMDSVEYISSAGVNELRLTKRLTPVRVDSRPLLRRLLNLRVRFSLATFFIVAAIIAAAHYYLDRRTAHYLQERLDGTVTALAKTIADQAAGYIINRRSDVEFDQLIVSYLRANPELKLIVLTDTAGIILAHSEDIARIRESYQPPVTAVSDGSLAIQTVPIRTGGRALGQVHVRYSSALIHNQITMARWRLLILTGVLLVFGVFGIYLLSNYFVRPIARITERVRRYTTGDLQTELPLEGAEEFFEISRAFNEMITRISRDQAQIVAKEKLAKEIEVASQIQHTLFPGELPSIPDLQVDAFYRVAETMGGDLYDVFPVSADRSFFVVADVSGTGVPASLVMSMLRTVIRVLAPDAASPRELLVKVAEFLGEHIPSGMFITVQLAMYVSVGRELRLVSAGHNPLLHFQAETGVLNQVNPSGMPLGMPAALDQTFETALEEVSLTLQDGDSVLMYSDGLTEAMGQEGNRFGIDRLSQLVSEQAVGDPVATAGDLKRVIVSQIEEFAAFGPVQDDMTFVVARVPMVQSQVADSEHPKPELSEVDIYKVEQGKSG